MNFTSPRTFLDENFERDETVCKAHPCKGQLERQAVPRANERAMRRMFGGRSRD